MQEEQTMAAASRCTQLQSHDLHDGPVLMPATEVCLTFYVSSSFSWLLEAHGCHSNDLT